MSNSAIFTIVKNEKIFIPIWLKHYRNFFDDKDIYILNHESTDGSIDNLNVNIINIYNDLGFDHQWLVNQVQNIQVELLKSYKSVLFTEIDELVYTIDKPLNIIIDEFNSSINELQNCIAYEIYQDLQNEESFIVGDNIFQQRKYWFRTKFYDKPLLTKKPLNYNWGFHTAKDEITDQSFNIFLCHLHRFDFELMLKRHEERSKWNLKNDGIAGHQHKIFERSKLLKYYKNIESELEYIPENHSRILMQLQS